MDPAAQAYLTGALIALTLLALILVAEDRWMP